MYRHGALIAGIDTGIAVAVMRHHFAAGGLDTAGHLRRIIIGGLT